MSTDRIRRFLFENQPLRGHWVRLEQAWRELRAHQDLPPELRSLLGEAVTAAVLLAGTLKFRGTLTLQLSGHEDSGGRVQLLVVQATHDYRVRGMLGLRETDAETADGAPDSSSLRTLVGSGRLVVTIDAGEGAAPYQGIVPLEGETLAACLESYFATSEQIPTRLVLVADGERAAGLLLQRLPTPESRGEAAAGEAHEAWEAASAALATLQAARLLTDEPQELLRIFGEYDLRLFEGAPVRFECRCDSQRVASILRALGPDDLRALLAEQGEITVTCEFCRRPYRFDAIEVERLFADGIVPDGPPALH